MNFKIFIMGCFFVFLTGCANNSYISKDSKTEWVPQKTVVGNFLAENSKKALRGKNSLITLIEVGLNKNPQAKQAWWQAKASLARQKQAEASFLPRIDVGLNATRQQSGSLQGNSTKRTDTWGPFVEISYKIFQFGADAAAAESAAHVLKASNYAFNNALQATILEIQKNYYQFASAKAKIIACESSFKDASSSFEAVSKKKDNGLARTQDWLLAQADKLQADYELKFAEANLEACRANLAVAIGVPISEDFDIDETYFTNTNTDIGYDISKLLDDTLNKQTEILKANEELLAQKYKYKSKARNMLPSINLFVDANKTKFSSKWQKNYSMALGLKWNLFSGSDLQYQKIEQYSAMKAQKHALRQKQLNAIRNTWTTFHAFKSSLQLLESSTALENAALETLAAIRIGYDAGINSLLDLLSAQKTLSSARLKRVQAQTDVSLNLVSLAYCTGNLDTTNSIKFNL